MCVRCTEIKSSVQYTPKCRTVYFRMGSWMNLIVSMLILFLILFLGLNIYYL